MKRLFSIAVLLTSAMSASAAEPLKSGPQVGDKVPGAFEPFNLTGTNAGEECCLFCKFGNDPSIMVFARQTSDALTALTKRLDELTVKHKKADLGSCVIYCQKGTALHDPLKAQAAKLGLKETILATIDAPPKQYAISKDADVTVLIYTGAAVKANHAFRKGELDEKGIEAIVKDVGKILPK